MPLIVHPAEQVLSLYSDYYPNSWPHACCSCSLSERFPPPWVTACSTFAASSVSLPLCVLYLCNRLNQQAASRLYSRATWWVTLHTIKPGNQFIQCRLYALPSSPRRNPATSLLIRQNRGNFLARVCVYVFVPAVPIASGGEGSSPVVTSFNIN